MGTEHSHNHKNRREVPPRNLHHGGTCDPIEVDILQRVTRNTGYTFAGVDNILQEIFLPHLFFGKYKYLTTLIGTLFTMPINREGLGVQNPVFLSVGLVSKTSKLIHYRVVLFQSPNSGLVDL